MQLTTKGNPHQKEKVYPFPHHSTFPGKFPQCVENKGFKETEMDITIG